MSVIQTEPHIPLPRWKATYDQLYSDLGRFEYGSAFYSIPEVCRRCNVSTITAIRALNELAVRGLIEKVPGKGNVARHLSSPVRIRLVVSMDDPQAYTRLWPIAQRIIQGISEAAGQEKLDFDMLSASHIPSLFPDHQPSMGFLLFGVNLAPAIREYLEARRFPVVWVDPFTNYQAIAHARVDRFQAGFLAARHLLELGHQRIAWITGNLLRPNFRDRLRGYRRALQQAGIALDWSLIRQTRGVGPDRAHEEETAFLSLMRLPNPPTAIILGDDSRGVHVLDACRRHGIRVPEQLSVLGFPNLSESRLTTPPLSVIDAMYERVGAAAVQLLMQRMLTPDSQARQSILVRPELVKRASTGPAPAR